jgi:hypothetical protein
MVYDGKTSRETQQTIRHMPTRYPRKLGLRGAQLREWMTVARDRSAWGRKEYKLNFLRAHSTNLHIERNTNDILTKLA